ncbi:hypothetical protein IWW37_000600 [Coemansia sp. RSA 2050]|nr:hypothetical protein IWW37_000600 [Coemansia sp. RSA 2050]KAJ2732811.1 hypothetical protein IW152_003535 [Coemansia sp. BCRC 34962]
MVVDHIAGSSRMSLSGIAIGSQRYLELHTPLLWVCRSFRAIVYARFSSRYEMHFKRNTDSEGVALVSWPRRFQQFDRPTQHLAKELMLGFDVWGVYIGKALEMLNSALLDECAFPAVRLLDIRFSREPMQCQLEDVAADPDRVQANIDALVSRIKRMAPMVNEVRVASRFYSSDLPPTTGKCFGNLVSRLYQLASRVTYSSYNGSVFVVLELDRISELVSMDYKVCNNNYRQIMQLARRNASTLQSLVINSRAAIDLSGLIQDADGAFMEYSRLQTLKLAWRADVTTLRRLTFKGALPLPKLRHLHVPQDYPFGDDTLFRGNAPTLEFLSINLNDCVLVGILSSYCVFTPTSHPKLQCVKTSHLPSITPDLAAAVDVVDFMRLALNIAPGASVREIHNQSTGPDLQTGLSLLRNHITIQVLVLPKLCLSLWDVVALVKALPLLSDLHTLPPYLGENPDGISQDQLSSYVCSNYAPMGKRFRCWRVGYNWGQNPEEAITCVQLLALACPSFTHVVPPISDYKRATEPTAEANESSDFNECAL